MVTEFETRILDINKETIISKLKLIGAKEIFSTKFRRYVFDFDSTGNKWIRLRDEGHKCTLTYKSRQNTSISGTEEIETTVQDFDTTALIIKQIPFENIYYQENKRTLFKLNEIEFCIDEWPKIPAFLEIESFSEENVINGLKLLNLEKSNHANNSIVDVYKHYGIELHNIHNLKFED
jgi:adenylate cyclase, class 2